MESCKSRAIHGWMWSVSGDIVRDGRDLALKKSSGYCNNRRPIATGMGKKSCVLRVPHGMMALLGEKNGQTGPGRPHQCTWRGMQCSDRTERQRSTAALLDFCSIDRGAAASTSGEQVRKTARKRLAHGVAERGLPCRRICDQLRVESAAVAQLLRWFRWRGWVLMHPLARRTAKLHSLRPRYERRGTRSGKES